MTHRSLLDASALDLAAALRRGEVSVVGLLAQALDRVAERNPVVTAVSAVTREQALLVAARLDALPAADRDALALFGVPVLVKEEIDVAGCVTTFGGRGNRTPRERDAEVVRRLRSAGAVVIGKTHMPEFGQAPFTEGAWGATRNPWAPGVSPGGSSGGSAAAVAVGMAPIALGGDAGGSIRIPAGVNGVVGVKPTRRLVPTDPNEDLWCDLGVLGPITRTVADAAVALSVLADRRVSVAVPAEPLRVGWTLQSGLPGVVADTVNTGVLHRATSLLARQGHSVREVRLRTPPKPWAYLVQVYAGILDERDLVEHPELLEPRSRHTLAIARRLPRRVVDAARRDGLRVAESVNTVFDEVDVLVQPLLPGPIGPIRELSRRSGPASQAASSRTIAYVSTWNLCGNPSVAVPLAVGADGVPLAVQVVAAPGRDEVALAAAAALEAGTAASTHALSTPIWPAR